MRFGRSSTDEAGSTGDSLSAAQSYLEAMRSDGLRGIIVARFLHQVRSFANEIKESAFGACSKFAGRLRFSLLIQNGYPRTEVQQGSMVLIFTSFPKLENGLLRRSMKVDVELLEQKNIQLLSRVT